MFVTDTLWFCDDMTNKKQITQLRFCHGNFLFCKIANNAVDKLVQRAIYMNMLKEGKQIMMSFVRNKIIRFFSGRIYH